MNAEQKQRAIELVIEWNTHYPEYVGDRMATLLQELVEAPEPDPSARVTGYYAGYLSIATVDGRVLPAGTALYTTPPAPETEPVGYLYTNVLSGEYHVSDYDDDYRGPERALWHIEPVYRKTKGQS